MFGSDLEHRVWSRFWNWNLANILRLVLTWDLTIFGNTIGNKDRGEVIARTWFHSFFSRKKSEIWIAFTFFEKWKVKNKIPSLFFEKWKWNWNSLRSRTRSENEKEFSRILEQRESRWSLCRDLCIDVVRWSKWQKNGAFVSESSKYWVMADSLMLRGTNRFYSSWGRKRSTWGQFLYNWCNTLMGASMYQCITHLKINVVTCYDSAKTW